MNCAEFALNRAPNFTFYTLPFPKIWSHEVQVSASYFEFLSKNDVDELAWFVRKIAIRSNKIYKCWPSHIKFLHKNSVNELYFTCS